MSSIDKVLVLGATGQVGGALLRTLDRAGIPWWASTRTGQLPDGRPCVRADLAVTGSAAAAVAELRPALVINATAYTAVDRAESELAIAYRINSEAVGELGEAAKRVGARIVHYSTDYVFDGNAKRPYREDDATAPVSAYGRSKLGGEQALFSSGAEALQLRLAWVYASTGTNFLRTMLRIGVGQERLRVVADQIGTPTPAHWIAEATLRAIDAGATGLFHLSPQGKTSWHEYAEAIFAGALHRGLLTRTPIIEAITTEEYPTPARRPAWSLLDSSKLAREVGIALPDWQKGLNEVLDAIASSS